jgi:hypothetical protein
MASKAGSAASAGSAAGKKKQAALEFSPQIEIAVTKALAVRRTTYSHSNYVYSIYPSTCI